MDAPQESKRRRRWLQYSLRTFLVAMCVVACALGWLADRVHRRNEALAKIQEMGGRVTLDLQGESYVPRWLRQCLDEQYFGSVEYIVFFPESRIAQDDLACLRELPETKHLWFAESHVDDDALRHVKYLTDLRELRLHFTQTGNMGLAGLNQLRSLESLSLLGTQIGDAGLAHISQLTSLRELNLSATQVSDRGLTYLSSLQNLRVLDLGFTDVTAKGCRYLQRLASLEDVRLPWSDNPNEMVLAAEALRKALPNGSVYPSLADPTLRRAWNLSFPNGVVTGQSAEAGQ